MLSDTELVALITPSSLLKIISCNRDQKVGPTPGSDTYDVGMGVITKLNS